MSSKPPNGAPSSPERLVTAPEEKVHGEVPGTTQVHNLTSSMVPSTRPELFLARTAT